MADDLQANLQNYVLQLQQVEAALTIDPDNQELQKLKNDLEEVLTLTKDLIKQQLIESGKGSFPGGSSDSAAILTDQDILNTIPKHKFKVGDHCMVMSSDDGMYYEGIILDISDETEQVSVKIEHNGLIEITAPSFLKQIVKPNVKKKSDQEHKHKKHSQSQREYQKKKKLKKQMRYKQLEEERETEKNKWLAFTSKKKGGLLTKKSIFASPDSVTGRVGIGTCGEKQKVFLRWSNAAIEVVRATILIKPNQKDSIFKMAKATSIKDALKRWEEKHEKSASEATEIFLCFQWPPIEKMDNSLASLTNCTRLSLSTNMIEKISGVGSLKNLKILSLGRNYIKSFAGLEALGETLEELWISYNLIEKLKGVNVLKNLKVLYISNNLIREWSEFNKLQELLLLEDLLFVGNPLHESMEENVWKIEAPKRLPNLKKLDGEPVINEEVPQIVQPPTDAEHEVES